MYCDWLENRSFSHSINKISVPALCSHNRPRNNVFHLCERGVLRCLKHWIKHIENEMEGMRVNIGEPTASLFHLRESEQLLCQKQKCSLCSFVFLSIFPIAVRLLHTFKWKMVKSFRTMHVYCSKLLLNFLALDCTGQAVKGAYLVGIQMYEHNYHLTHLSSRSLSLRVCVSFSKCKIISQKFNKMSKSFIESAMYSMTVSTFFIVGLCLYSMYSIAEYLPEYTRIFLPLILIKLRPTCVHCLPFANQPTNSQKSTNIPKW